MNKTKKSTVGSLAVLTLVATMSLVGCASHDSAATMTPPAPMAETTTTPANTAMTSPRSKNVEARIEALHDKLKITPIQEQQWSVVAQAMRDNEAAIHALIEERHAQAKTQTAVDDLESYEKIADEHADGLKRLIPAFKALYGTMSDVQKKNADAVFGKYEGHRDHKGHKGHKAKHAK